MDCRSTGSICPGSWVLDDAVYFQFHITIRTAMRRAADVLELQGGIPGSARRRRVVHAGDASAT